MGKCMSVSDIVSWPLELFPVKQVTSGISAVKSEKCTQAVKQKVGWFSVNVETRHMGVLCCCGLVLYQPLPSSSSPSSTSSSLLTRHSNFHFRRPPYNCVHLLTSKRPTLVSISPSSLPQHLICVRLRWLLSSTETRAPPPRLPVVVESPPVTVAVEAGGNPPPDKPAPPKKRKRAAKHCGRCGQTDHTEEEHYMRTLADAVDVLVNYLHTTRRMELTSR